MQQLVSAAATAAIGRPPSAIWAASRQVLDCLHTAASAAAPGRAAGGTPSSCSRCTGACTCSHLNSSCPLSRPVTPTAPARLLTLLPLARRGLAAPHACCRPAPALGCLAAAPNLPRRSFASAAQPDDEPARGGSRGSGPQQGTTNVQQEAAARMAMEDPMSRLLASRGVPLGMSLRPTGQSPAEPAAAADEEGVTRPPAPAPGYDMEAFSEVLRATAAAGRRAEEGDPLGGSTSAAAAVAGVQHVGPSLEDSWGTTRQSAADIARHIADSNAASAPGAAGEEDRASDADSDAEDGPDAALALSAAEVKYSSLEAMSADIKRLDEVWEVLASVPWLNEDNLSDKELKGVAMVGLLGTLEEVGFNIRPLVMRIWAGEHGAELASGPGLEARDQAALIAILYHTKQIFDKYGHPEGGYIKGR